MQTDRFGSVGDWLLETREFPEWRGVGSRVPNSLRKTELNQLVRSKVRSGLMMEIRLTGQSGLSDLTRPGLVRPGLPSNWIWTVL